MKDNKSILLIIPTFGIGGTPVSTLNLALSLRQEGYSVSIMSLWPKGDTKTLFEAQADLPIIACPFILKALGACCWKEFDSFISRFLAICIRVLAKKSFMFKVLVNKPINKIAAKYDIIAACEEGVVSRMVSYCKNKKTIAWVRCDYEKYYESHQQHLELYYYNFNHIVCVSNNSMKGFLKVYPDLADRTTHIDNVQIGALLKSFADQNDNDPRFVHDRFTIVSVGRYSPVKRFDQIPQIAKTLVDKGVSFRWYIIGGLNQQVEDAIANDIRNYALKDEVIQLGVKSNPYYYIKNSDLLVSLSTTEACPRVVNEAKIFGVPVVSTDYPSIYDYISDGVNGRIVNINQMADVISELSSKGEQYIKYKESLAGFEFDNRKLMQQLLQIL